jgi:Holliday junction DNA helicase RuvA
MIEFEERGEQEQARAGVGGRHSFQGPESDVLFPRRLDFGEIDVSIVGDFVSLAHFDTQDSRQVAGVVTGDFGVPVADIVYKKSAPHAVFLNLMIAHLRGTLLEKHPNLAVVDVHGVGYEIAIPVSAFSSLPEQGQPVALHIHTHVREDALALFGFLTRADKALFEKLITVSGIGPKLAITALSGLTAPDLVNAIRAGAVEQLVRIPGVGKKTAERMILELRDKLDLLGMPDRAVAAAPRASFSDTEEDVISALMNFGANRASAESAVTKARSASAGNDFDALFRRALKLVR